MENVSETEEQGIACALGKICSLESRLRDAIQSTHSLHRSFGRDMGAVDRERAALLVVREHLEGLEDKLRDYKTAISDPRLYDEKAIALSQMDTYRKDLLRASKDKVDEVLFNKDVVKDILAFADTGAGDEALPDVAHDIQQNRTASPSPSSRSSGETEHTAHTGEFSEAASYLTNSTSNSPYGPRKEMYGHLLHVDGGQENSFLHPIQATTPSIHASQYPRDYTFNHASSEPSRRYQPSKYDLGSELVAASHASEDEDLFLGKARVLRSENDSLLSNYTQSRSVPRVPTSIQGSCETPMRALSNTTNLNVNGPPPDRCYGGKLTFKSREERGAQAKHPAMPVSPVPKSEPPRVLNDPTYSESSSGDNAASDETRQAIQNDAASSIQPNRVILEKRAAAQRPQHPQKDRLVAVKALFAGLFTLAYWPVQLGRRIDMGSSVRNVSAAVTGAASALIITKAICHKGYVPSLTPRPRRRPVRRPMRLRADGALVPEWMHRSSQFRASENPPVGALTSTAGPPQGEMFPVIPPPSSRCIKG